MKKADNGIPKLCQAAGFQCEEHEIVTADRYILTVHRITPKSPKQGPVVFLQHGLLDSAASFMLIENISLSFLLASKGYDVWLGNSRGNRYSSRHQTMKPSESAFWEFSWDQMAQYDLPACIDYVLNFTKQPDLTYIGHSQGCTIAFALLATQPEYGKKINLFVSLAPAPILGHLKVALFQALARMSAEEIRLILGDKVLLPSSLDYPVDVLCKLSPSGCHSMLCLICGCNGSFSLPPAEMIVLMAHFPSGTSVQNMIHYSQSVKHGGFQMYDYGREKNMKIYGQPTPPLYKYENLDANLAFFYGKEDQLADARDVEMLISKQTNPLYVSKLGFGHGDFVWDTYAKPFVYDPLMGLMERTLMMRK